MSSLREVARACQVSTATVSYVINNGPRPVAPETRQRVLQTMRELNYRPRALHFGERAKRSNTLGVLFTDNPQGTGLSRYVRPVLDGVLPRALHQEQSVLLLGQHDWSNAHRSLRNYCDGRCDGLLLIALPMNNPIVPALRERGFPFVLLGSTGPDCDGPSVDMDNVAAAAEMTRYLLSLGHRRVAMLPGVPVLWGATQRVEGYRQALEAAGVYDDSLVVYDGTVDERIARLLAGGAASSPTAIFCGSDVIALEALQSLQARGLRVPEDISVVGFDDIEESATADPPLTTMHQSLRQQGEMAFDLLLDIIHGDAVPTAKTTLPTELAVRASAAPPPLLARPATRTA